MTETAQDHSRTARRRPFTTWVKKLAHFKGGASSSSSSGADRHPSKTSSSTSKKRASKNNNPYPLSGRLGVIDNPNRFASDHGESISHSYNENENDENYYGPHRSHPSFASRQSGVTPSSTSIGRSRRSSLIESASDDGRAPPTAGALSVAPTVSTDHGGTPRSVLAPSAGAASSITGTSRTINGPGSRRGGDSTFSSPAPSVRSLTTTLTTIQSLAPAAAMGQANGGGATSNGTASVGMTFSSHHGHHHHHHHNASQQSNGTQTIQFHQPFPSTPASAIPSHLTPLPNNAGPGHPATYSTATANNLLTDNASILTLASSSKRRRRRSIDTDASVRALAPSSLFGGSRESLPLSILSANIEGPSSTSALMPSTSANSNAGPPPGSVALHTTNSRMSVASTGLSNSAAVAAANAATAAAAERNSIYSSTGILGGDRNSFYARQSLGGGGMTGDAASIRSGRSGRSGFLGHGRSESITGSIGGSLTSPLASPLASPRETEAEEASSGLTASIATIKTANTDDAGSGEAAEKADEEK
ncbi:hypothetical protein Sste5346_003296 [Sporothrix stenoceras]|uniref:Ca2+-modulated nonselective cation channel polycystin n=1 Tax=Sporothrix stenoceras TaxID=5173 RepID=A0ABR3ZDX4_9PEZI